MRFAEIIRESGINVESYPLASELSISVYDRKKHPVTLSSIHFNEKLFAKNGFSIMRFKSFLDGLEKKLFFGDTVDSIKVTVTETLVTICVDLCPPLILFRS